MERLVHYAHAPLSGLRADYRRKEAPPGKPPGFWFSVDGDGDGWADWCQGEGYPLGPLAYEVVLAPDAHLVRLSSAADLDAFTRRYSGELYPGLEVPPDVAGGIDWARVAQTAVDGPTPYQGIIIAPYIHSRRLEPHTFWYYGWDCASGVVWDVSAVAELRRIGVTARTEAPALPPRGRVGRGLRA